MKFIPSYTAALVAFLGALSVYFGWFDVELSLLMFRYGFLASVLAWAMGHEQERIEMEKKINTQIDLKFKEMTEEITDLLEALNRST